VSDEKNGSPPLSGGILPKEEEEALRKQIRSRLEADYQRQQAKQKKEDTNPLVAEQLRAERIRIIHEEEDAFYAERGLFRYRNHRGEYEWLTKEERDRRLAAGKEPRYRRSKRSLWEKMGGGRFGGDLINGLIVVVVLIVAVIVFRREESSSTAFAVQVQSEPPGAAIFVDGQSANLSTNARVSVPNAGFHRIHVVRPGYRAVPASKEIRVAEDNPEPVVLFTLYPVANDTTHHTGSPQR